MTPTLIHYVSGKAHYWTTPRPEVTERLSDEYRKEYNSSLQEWQQSFKVAEFAERHEFAICRIICQTLNEGFLASKTHDITPFCEIKEDGLAYFLEPKQEVETQEYHLMLSLFGNYLLITNSKMRYSNEVEEVIQKFLTSDYYLTRKQKCTELESQLTTMKQRGDRLAEALNVAGKESVKVITTLSNYIYDNGSANTEELQLVLKCGEITMALEEKVGKALTSWNSTSQDQTKTDENG